MQKSKLLQKYTAYEREVEILLRQMEAYNDEQLNRLPVKGGWSAMQVAHHLLLVESLALRYVQKKLGFQPVLKKAGAVEWLRLWALLVYLNTPLRFKAPDAVGEQHLPASITLAQTQQQWADVRTAWRSFLAQMPEELCDKAVFRHPFVGRLSWAGMFSFFRAHLKRHRKQLQRVLGAA